MENFMVFTLENQDGYAISLPITGLSDPNLGRVMTLFERMVDWAKLRDFHKNPVDQGFTEQQQIDILNKYYYYNEDLNLFMALFFISQSDAAYNHLLRFAEVTKETFKKNNML